MDKFTVDDSLLSGLRHRVATALRLARARPGIVALSLVLACHGALAQAVYHITPLGSLDGCTTYVAVAAGLNEADQVTGSACTPTSSSHAFLWKNDGTPMVDLGPSQVGSFSHAQALNSSGLVIGETSGSSSGSFLAGGGKPMRSIPDGLGGNTVQAWAINGRGQVTGSAETGCRGRLSMEKRRFPDA